jgi:hypothetical protein
MHSFSGSDSSVSENENSKSKNPEQFIETEIDTNYLVYEQGQDNMNENEENEEEDEGDEEDQELEKLLVEYDQVKSKQVFKFDDKNKMASSVMDEDM